jgi:hypothetical protein
VRGEGRAVRAVMDGERERDEAWFGGRKKTLALSLLSTPLSLPPMAAPPPQQQPPVRLISSDGFEFVVDHEAACVSNTIKHMLASEGVREREKDCESGNERAGGGGLSYRTRARATTRGRARVARAGRDVPSGGGRKGTHSSLGGEREREQRESGAAVNALPIPTHRPLNLTSPCPPFPTGGFAEAELRRVTFPEIPGAVLEKVCEYMHYKLQYAEAPAKAIPDFGLPPELALELLKASNFLDI